MKTPEETKKGLECCGTGDFGNHKDCPYDIAEPKCMQNLLADALAYIQRLEAENKSFMETIDLLHMYVNHLETKCHQLEHERDAEVAEYDTL